MNYNVATQNYHGFKPTRRQNTQQKYKKKAQLLPLLPPLLLPPLLLPPLLPPLPLVPLVPLVPLPLPHCLQRDSGQNQSQSHQKLRREDLLMNQMVLRKNQSLDLSQGLGVFSNPVRKKLRMQPLHAKQHPRMTSYF
jgi:hypothetical protein